MIPVQVSPKHKLVGVPLSPAVRNLFPEGKELVYKGAPTLLLPHGATETFMLRKLGFDVPAPILSHYDWPGTLEPFDVQKKTGALLTLNQRAYVLNDLGTGKTKSLLWAWDYLRSNNLAGKLLILAPLSTLEFTWSREIFETLPHRKSMVLHGSKAVRRARLADPDTEIFIINHDGVETILDELMARTDIDTLGIDELAVYRNATAKRSKVVTKLAKKMRWAWGMTGRPIPRAPTDVYGQAKILTPNTVPKFFGRLRESLMLKVSDFTWVPKHDAAERAFECLQPAVRYSIDDVAELPELIVRAIDVRMGPDQARIYNKLAKECYVKLQAQEITAANAGVAMSKLVQIATGWVYCRDGSVMALDNGARLDQMLSDIDNTNRKALVFVPYKHALAGVAAVLTEEKIDHACVSGDTPMGRRAEIFSLFQNTTRYKVLVAHPQCLAHGITLTAADTIIWFGPITSLDIFDQANARIRRVGQKHKQLVFKYQGTPVEKKIYKMLENNQKIQDQLLELFEDASD
jgi:SNF2 family DNA or RNA helicase